MISWSLSLFFLSEHELFHPLSCFFLSHANPDIQGCKCTKLCSGTFYLQLKICIKCCNNYKATCFISTLHLPTAIYKPCLFITLDLSRRPCPFLRKPIKCTRTLALSFFHYVSVIFSKCWHSTFDYKSLTKHGENDTMLSTLSKLTSNVFNNLWFFSSLRCGPMNYALFLAIFVLTLFGL